MSNRPSHRAYIVEDRQAQPGEDQQQGFWHRVGSAWPHADGKGLQIQLVPGIAVSGRLVLREYTAEDEAREPKPKTKK